MYYSKRDYDLIGFEKSHLANKKYNAILVDRNNRERMIRVPFGAIRPDGEPYEQYKDLTGLNLYSDWDHNDKKRRKRFVQRHKRNFKHNMYSPTYFAIHYLWEEPHYFG
jgi:hypothetical protein